MNPSVANIRKSVSHERGEKMDRDTKHFAIVAAIIGILLTLVMIYYANKSDKLVDDYASGKLTLNIETPEGLWITKLSKATKHMTRE